MSKFSNGDAVIDSCFFCQTEFSESQKLNTVIHCNEEQGGCGNRYRLTMLNSTNIKTGDSDE